MKHHNPALFIAAATSIQMASSALAADAYGNACASYAAGNYVVAKTQFLVAVKMKPTWRAYYQLANCYVQLKDTNNAKAAYEHCLALKPQADIKKQCEQAIGYLGKTSLTAAPAVPSRAAAPASSVVRTTPAHWSSGGNSTDDSRQRAIQAHKERIMADAERQVQALRAEAKAQMEDMQSNANQRYLLPDGTVKTEVDPAMTARFTNELETKVQRIMDEARRQADLVTSP